MKTSAVITAALLAFAGAAYAVDVPANNNMEQANPKAAKNFTDLKNKTKRGMHRLGNKVRHIAHRDTRNNTAAMGASSDDLHRDSSRQKRMDDAYANWRAKQK